jgi:ATP-dependent Lon protease
MRLTSHFLPAARVIRISRSGAPLASSESAFSLTLQGLTRIYSTESLPAALPLDSLKIFSVTYPSLDDPGEAPSREIVHTFRTAAFRLLDRLDLESPHQSKPPSSRIRPDVWRKLRSLVQEVNEDGAVWL